MAILQGFAKHRGRGEGREVGLRLGEVKLMCWQPQNPQVYIGEREEGAPPSRVPTPRGAAALDGKGGGGQEGRGKGGAARWALRPIPFRVCPLPTS